MKTLSALVVASLLAFAGSASAASCGQLAANCIKNGGTKDRCYAPSLMNTCQKTGTYIGPYSGKSFSATLERQASKK